MATNRLHFPADDGEERSTGANAIVDDAGFLTVVQVRVFEAGLATFKAQYGQRERTLAERILRERVFGRSVWTICPWGGRWINWSRLLAQAQAMPPRRQPWDWGRRFPVGPARPIGPPAKTPWSGYGNLGDAIFEICFRQWNELLDVVDGEGWILSDLEGKKLDRPASPETGVLRRKGVKLDLRRGDLLDYDGSLLAKAPKFQRLVAVTRTGAVQESIAVPPTRLNVVTIKRDQKPAPTHHVARPRGASPKVRDRVKNAMCAQLAVGGNQAAADLRKMKEEAMSATYSASRDTCRKARDEALSEFQSRQIATNDK